MSTSGASGRVVIGMDPHKRSATIEVMTGDETIVGGDARSYSIAAASIIAKVTRDRYMRGLAAAFPGYGWETNVGYARPEHLAALNRLGATAHHRRSFAPVRMVLEPTLPLELVDAPADD